MKKVLIFDDDQGILEVTKIILTDKGYQVKTATSFLNALGLINDFKPDLVLMDLWMPQMNGEEIIKKIRNDPQNKNLPIVVISASNATSEVASKCGANDYLSKPFNIEDFELLIGKYLN